MMNSQLPRITGRYPPKVSMLLFSLLLGLCLPALAEIDNGGSSSLVLAKRTHTIHATKRSWITPRKSSSANPSIPDNPSPIQFLIDDKINKKGSTAKQKRPVLSWFGIRTPSTIPNQRIVSKPRSIIHPSVLAFLRGGDNGRRSSTNHGKSRRRSKRSHTSKSKSKRKTSQRKLKAATTKRSKIRKRSNDTTGTPPTTTRRKKSKSKTKGIKKKLNTSNVDRRKDGDILEENDKPYQTSPTSSRAAFVAASTDNHGIRKKKKTKKKPKTKGEVAPMSISSAASKDTTVKKKKKKKKRKTKSSMESVFSTAPEATPSLTEHDTSASTETISPTTTALEPLTKAKRKKRRKQSTPVKSKKKSTKAASKQTGANNDAINDSAESPLTQNKRRKKKKRKVKESSFLNPDPNDEPDGTALGKAEKESKVALESDSLQVPAASIVSSTASHTEDEPKEQETTYNATPSEATSDSPGAATTITMEVGLGDNDTPPSLSSSESYRASDKLSEEEVNKKLEETINSVMEITRESISPGPVPAVTAVTVDTELPTVEEADEDQEKPEESVDSMTAASVDAAASNTTLPLAVDNKPSATEEGDDKDFSKEEESKLSEVRSTEFTPGGTSMENSSTDENDSEIVSTNSTAPDVNSEEDGVDNSEEDGVDNNEPPSADESRQQANPQEDLETADIAEAPEQPEQQPNQNIDSDAGEEAEDIAAELSGDDGKMSKNVDGGPGKDEDTDSDTETTEGEESENNTAPDATTITASSKASLKGEFDQHKARGSSQEDLLESNAFSVVDQQDNKTSQPTNVSLSRDLSSSSEEEIDVHVHVDEVDVTIHVDSKEIYVHLDDVHDGVNNTATTDQGGIAAEGESATMEMQQLDVAANLTMNDKATTHASADTVREEERQHEASTDDDTESDPEKDTGKGAFAVCTGKSKSDDSESESASDTDESDLDTKKSSRASNEEDKPETSDSDDSDANTDDSDPATDEATQASTEDNRPAVDENNHTGSTNGRDAGSDDKEEMPKTNDSPYKTSPNSTRAAYAGYTRSMTEGGEYSGFCDNDINNPDQSTNQMVENEKSLANTDDDDVVDNVASEETAHNMQRNEVEGNSPAYFDSKQPTLGVNGGSQSDESTPSSNSAPEPSTQLEEAGCDQNEAQVSDRKADEVKQVNINDPAQATSDLAPLLAADNVDRLETEPSKALGGFPAQSDTKDRNLSSVQPKREKVDIANLLTPPDDISDIKVSVVTWNLAETSPEEEEATFIKRFRGSDLVLISGQECENIKPRRTEGRRSREYRRLMIKMLGKKYIPLGMHLLGGIQFGLFCKRSFLHNVEFASIADVTCGIGNVFHNKGAICAYLQIKASKTTAGAGSDKKRAKSLKMLFITAHMAAHVKNSEARDADFWRIVQELELQAPTRFLVPNPNINEDGEVQERLHGESDSGSYLLDSMDRVFFCGDLNYRINLPREEVEHTIEQMEKNPAKANGLREKLLRHDQLLATVAERNAFVGLAEGKITFLPTFKFDKGTADYDTSHKQRIPAWTDRVMYKPAGTRILEYGSVPDSTHSDHRPVYATFRVNTFGRKLPPIISKRKRKRSKPSSGSRKSSRRYDHQERQ